MSNFKPADMELAPGALLECPGCGLPAEISERFTLDGAPEPIAHVKVVCVRRHWYTVPVDMFPECIVVQRPRAPQGDKATMTANRHH
ncbi:MAG: hypothetical protein ACRDRD_17740 [Pseudonocardiaceae bacterium]